MKNLILFSLFVLTSTPLFSQLSREIGFFRQSYYDKGTKLSKTEVAELFKKVDLSNQHWQTARKNEKLSYILSGITMGGIIYSLASNLDDNTELVVSIGSLATGIASLFYSFDANKQYNLAVRTYNEALGEGKIGFEAKFYLSPSKVGLIANF